MWWSYFPCITHDLRPAVRHLSEPAVAGAALAVYPPATGEPPLNAGILDLATHQACGTVGRPTARWALTPPFHPCRCLEVSETVRRLFSVTLLCGRPQLPVKKHGARCCPDFPLAPHCVGRATNPPCAAVFLLICSAGVGCEVLIIRIRVLCLVLSCV